MKKILCVMVAVVLCFGAVLVTASAETPMYSYNGVELPYLPSDLVDTEYKYFVLLSESNGSYTMAVSTATFNHQITAVMAYRPCSVKYYTYNSSSAEWALFGSDEISSPKNISSADKLVWANYNLHQSVTNGSEISDSSKIEFNGDLDYSIPLPLPLYEEINGVTGEAVNGLSNDISDALGVLVPIGISIMAIFVGISLIPRVIFKFL